MKIYVLPSPIAKGTLGLLPKYNDTIIQHLSYFFVESTKRASQFIKPIQQNTRQQPQFFIVDKRTRREEIVHYFERELCGKEAGILSDAGCPGICDPGAEVVSVAHKQGYTVVPLIGPNAVVLALMASGLQGQNFHSHGYIPIQKDRRKHFLKRIEKISRNDNITQIFIETPYRNAQLLRDICQFCCADTLLCIAVDITGAQEYIRTQAISKWRKFHWKWEKLPAVFLLQAHLNY